MKEAMDLEQLQAFLRSIPVFSELSKDRLSWLARFFEESRFEDREIIFRHGETADAFYLVKEGEVAIFTDEVGKPVRLLGRVGPGEFFGGQGLLDASYRTASARTSVPSVLLRIARNVFLAFLLENPSVELRLRLVESRRQSENLASGADEDRREDVRIRVDRPVSVTQGRGGSLVCNLENLSMGGCCVSGVPGEWSPGAGVEFEMGLPGEKPFLRIAGRVAWRETVRVGVAFREKRSGHEERINQLLKKTLGESFPSTAQPA